MAYLPEFLSLIAVFTIAAIAPGADFACVLRESVRHGRRAGVAAACGMGAAILVHTSYTVLGLGLLISHSVIAFNVIKWCGAAYLVYIGIGALRAPAPSLPKVDGAAASPHRFWRSCGIGFLTNLLNPKATLFFLSLFSTIVSTGTPLALRFGYGAAMGLVLAGWFSLVAIFLTTPAMRAAFVRLGRWFNRATGVMLIGMGVRVALQKAVS